MRRVYVYERPLRGEPTVLDRVSIVFSFARHFSRAPAVHVVPRLDGSLTRPAEKKEEEEEEEEEKGKELSRRGRARSDALQRFLRKV